MGFDPMVQVIHQDDVARAIQRALTPGIRGIFNIAGPAPIALSKLIRIVGRPTVSVPYSLAKRALAAGFRWRLTSFPSPELDHIKYVCMVDDRRAREQLGFKPLCSLRDCVLALDEC
jgi:UDP-glucose 4-epimerase